LAAVDGVAQDVAHFRLHAATMLCRATLQSLFEFIFDVSHNDLGHS
jgi:hypothetical protein